MQTMDTIKVCWKKWVILNIRGIWRLIVNTKPGFRFFKGSWEVGVVPEFFSRLILSL